jgi:hypothetical protein
MKLTKGKIAKLYNKRKQTLKKKGKPKRGAGKSKTFRQNKKVNLSRRSLKRFAYSGGQLAPSAVVKDELDAGLQGVNDKLNDGLQGVNTGLSAADAGLSVANDLASNVPLVVPGSVEARAGISGVQEGVELAKSVIPEPIDATAEQLASTEEPISGQEPSQEPAAPLGEDVTLADEQVISPANEPELPKQTIEPELIEPVVSQELSEEPVVSQELSEEPVVSQELSEEPVVSQELSEEPAASSDEQNTILNDAVKTIVNEIAKQVESKLTDEAPTDDGFKAFTGAVGKMGGKRRNTRRFKLVKNKTKRAAA